MADPPSRSTVATVVAGCLVGAVLLAMVATVLLSLWWRPSAPMIDRGLLPPQLETALRVRDLQSLALALVVVLGVSTAVVAANRRRSRLAGGLAVATAVLAGAVVLARNRQSSTPRRPASRSGTGRYQTHRPRFSPVTRPASARSLR